ncbi:restriction endonuclease subunit S [Stutzerimonas sp. R40042]|uniref:restriction endonuclease subunit S n=1 Tax=Stutzerimonas sp. R40042 TaxID=2998559 RepID=UPI002279BD1A|nr:restriction endonuclease subunit S [Stutzerimonas sp. R40042]WAE61191.1 restriction endonuclease subunit S [Stutzerimonas sp. R40042]
MSFPTYPAYKDSGVEWLGAVPKDWEPIPFKYVAEFINGMAFKPEQWSESGIPIIRIENLNNGESFNYFEGPVEGRYHVKTGDLLFGWSGNRGTSFGPFLWHGIGLHYLNQHIFRMSGLRCDKKWLYWTLKAVTKTIEDQAHGIIGMVHVTKGKLGGIKIPLISPPEQFQIARFLDHETARIDDLIEEQQRLIELLKEKRQAVISHAVTKGLDPTVPMKDSGVEWLGEVPAHWALVPFGLAFEYQEGPGIMAVDFRDEGVPLVRISGVQGRWVTLEGCNYLEPSKVKEKWAHFRLDKGDLIISGSASMGLVSEVGEDAAGAVAYTGLIRLKPRANVSIRDFIRSVVGSYQFHAQIDLLKAGSTIQHFGPTHLSQMKVVLPPVNEQAQIAAYVDTISVQFDELLGEAENTNALLQERRSALISAAVTGKIDVRDWQPTASTQAPELAVAEAV